MKKKIFLSTAVIAIIMIATYFIYESKKPTPTAESKLYEVMENGEMVEVTSKQEKPIYPDKEVTKWEMSMQTKLEKIIAKETNLTKENVSLILASTTTEEKKDNYQVSCSMVLNTDTPFEKNTIHSIVETIINKVSEDKRMTISKDAIVITNSNSEMLN